MDDHVGAELETNRVADSYFSAETRDRNVFASSLVLSCIGCLP